MSTFFRLGRASGRTLTDQRPAGRFSRAARSATAVAVLTVLGVGAGVGLAAPASAAIGCTVNVVAHPDDDLFFQNPAVRNDIVARKCVSTVYVTSGDAGSGTTYSQNREKGVQAAYAKMAGVSNKWLTLRLPTGGQTVTSSVLISAPWVSLTFLRLPDGNLDGSGTSASQFTSLQQLYLGQIPSLKTVDSPIQTYTSASLIKTLGQVFTTLNATTVRTLDHLGDFDEGDHSDHYTVARFASIARAQYKPSASFVGYLGYPGTSLSANVTGKDLTAKQAALMAYAPYDSSMCQTLAACDARGDSQWLSRMHLATELHAVRPITPGNVAPAATVTYSSQDWVNGQQAKKAIDGVIDGFPGDSTAEWATQGGGAGSWLQLNWLEPIQMDTVVLYDRPNPSDWVTGGKLTFSDGSTVAVPALDNAGGPTTVTFPARKTTSLRMAITSVGPGTGNVGLAELQAWTAGSTPTYPAPAPAPVTPPPAPTCGTPTAPTTATAPTPTTMPAVTADLAAAASVTASSENAAGGQTAGKAVDGTVDGYPGDWTAEWATQGCAAGTWLQLTWPTAVTLDRIVLHDRPNANDQITGGTLTFADGSTVAVPALANDGSATTVSFPARSTTSVRLTITAVSATTGNVGLAEIQAWTAVPAAPAAPAAPAVPAAPAAPAVPPAPAAPAPPAAPPAPPVDLAATATLTGGLGSQSNGVGSWIQLNWGQAVTAGRLVVTNPTGNLGVTGATLTFADGSTVTLPATAVSGKTLTLAFPARATTSLRITVTSVQGTLANATKAALQVFAS
ncbi:hypothetical protein E4P40_12990 [Blastococcus sp. CT_GayMR20]|uniref:DUF7402 domain-containing protein n=1 Tax=Blastococcus sp. CT_GayMR20 TaxID=2559609 RepID=UPI001073BCA0|nr:discoidin domain-containing protein [Blastococcus sp. CT_GayMR20]TFV86358.1 hypothetical protein E4P40_12990 [Blastococcus sp. CT_GayMR20]